MKKEKSISKMFLLALMISFSCVNFLSSCSKDSTPAVVIVKTALQSAITSAQALLTAAKEGTAIGSYLAGAKTALQTAVTAATAVSTSTTATQTEVDNAVVNLNAAVATFATNKVAEIALANLVGQWKFNGDAKDATANGHDGTLKAGAAIWGAGMPMLTSDRFGNANSAYHFAAGGNIEVPYAASLNPAKTMTVSVWAKLDSTRAGNYMIALNRWNGYKLQFQDGNKAFFTAHAGANYFDRDDASFAAKLATWYHVVVTYDTAGEMAFYINGTLVKSWKDVTGDISAVKSTINLVFGQDLPTSLYNNVQANDADGNNFYGPWGGYFVGSMDDIRIYNIALTSAQVGALYAGENAQ